MAKNKFYQKRGFVVFTLLVLVLSLSINSPKSLAEDENGRLTDKIDISKPDSEEKHHLKVEGDSGRTLISEKIGQHVQEYGTRYINGVGSSIEYEMDIEPNQPLTLEFQEIHKRESGFINYDIYVNDTRVYSRSYNVKGSGPNHFFVKVTDQSLLGEETVTVKMVNRYDGEVNFGSIWAYSDFEALLEREKVNKPMLASILVALNFHDYEKDLQKLTELRNSFKGNDRVSVGFGVQIRYAKWSNNEVERQIDYVLKLSNDTAMPVNIQFDTWWAGTPAGPDGLGGYWTDVKYQQVTYDPNNGYGLSIPNQWSSTPWLTMNNERYNEFKKERLETHLSYLTQQLHHMKANGLHPEISGLVMDSEPAYWAKGMPGATAEQSADFNPSVISAAERDGLNLDPSDGLDLEEKLWLFNNVNEYNIIIADAMKNGLGIDPIITNENGIEYSDRQLYTKIFSQGFDEVSFPFNRESVYRFWETGLVDSATLGTEWTFLEARQSVDYQIAQGTVANTNLEASIVGQDFSTVSLAYANGFDHVFLYNLASSQYSALQDMINESDEIYEPYTYSLNLFSQDFDKDPLLHDVYDIENMRVYQGADFPLSVEDSSKPGYIIYRVSNGGKELGNLILDYYARAYDYGNPQESSKHVTISVSSDTNEWTEVKELRQLLPVRETISLSDYVSNNDELFVKFEVNADGLPNDLATWYGIQEIAFGIQPDESGHIDPTITLTEEEARTHHLWVAARKDAEKMLAEHHNELRHSDAYKQAVNKFSQGLYISAQNLIHQELSTMLPAEYIVNGKGVLDPYNVEFKLSNLDDIIKVNLKEVKKNKISLAYTSEVDTVAEITVNGLKNGHWYRIEHVDENEIIIRKGKGSKEAKKAINGSVTFNLDVKATPDDEKDLIGTITGDFRGYNKTRGIISVRPDQVRFNHAEMVEIPIADDARIIQSQNGEQGKSVSLDQLMRGEQLSVTIENEKAVKIEASYGYLRGEIDEIHQMTPYEMAKIKVDGQSYTFDLETDLKLKTQSGSMKNVVKLDLKEGDIVDFVYNPVNKRIIEIKDSIIVLHDDFESANHDAWKENAYSYENLKTGPIDENYPHRGLVPDDMTKPGEVVYKLTSQNEVFGDLGLSFKTRVIVGASNYLKIYAGTSPDELTLLADLRPELGSFNESRGIDLTDLAAGNKEIYVKFKLMTEQFNSWTHLNEISFRESISN